MLDKTVKPNGRFGVLELAKDSIAGMDVAIVQDKLLLSEFERAFIEARKVKEKYRACDGDSLCASRITIDSLNLNLMSMEKNTSEEVCSEDRPIAAYLGYQLEETKDCSEAGKEKDKFIESELGGVAKEAEKLQNKILRVRGMTIKGIQSAAKASSQLATEAEVLVYESRILEDARKMVDNKIEGKDQKTLNSILSTYESKHLQRMKDFALEAEYMRAQNYFIKNPPTQLQLEACP